MREELNLLPSVAKFQAAKIKLKKQINLVMIVSLGLWIFFGAAVFGWWGFGSYSFNKAKSENDKALNQYKLLVDNVVLLKKNKYQVSLVSKVLAERFEYGTSIDKVSQLFLENINVGNFQIKDRKKIIIKGSLIKGSDLVEVEEKVRDIDAGLISGFKSAKLNSISVESGIWSFEMEVDIL